MTSGVLLNLHETASLSILTSCQEDPQDVLFHPYTKSHALQVYGTVYMEHTFSL